MILKYFIKQSLKFTQKFLKCATKRSRMQKTILLLSNKNSWDFFKQLFLIPQKKLFKRNINYLGSINTQAKHIKINSIRLNK